jgi:hypothetical protein
VGYRADDVACRERCRAHGRDLVQNHFSLALFDQAFLKILN